jgi:predicted transcriptional regulator
MEVHLNSELQQKLGLLAAQQGMTSEALVVEAVERMVSHDEWFLREVEKGLEEADRGDLIDHAEVRRIIDQRYPG